MAKKFRPGIPDNFSFAVEPISDSVDVEPVRDLGDYLDEPPVMPRKGREEVAPQTPPAPPPETTVASAAVAPTPPPKPATVTATTPPPVQPAPAVAPTMPAPQAGPAAAAPGVDDTREERGGKSKGPRREVSMSPET